MYKNKQEDHEKRKNQEGSYSVYNHMYRYLMDNYEPEQLDNKPSMALESLEKQLAAEGLDYSLKGGNKITKEELLQHARSAISNFINNKVSMEILHRISAKNTRIVSILLLGTLRIYVGKDKFCIFTRFIFEYNIIINKEFYYARNRRTYGKTLAA